MESEASCEGSIISNSLSLSPIWSVSLHETCLPKSYISTPNNYSDCTRPNNGLCCFIFHYIIVLYNPIIVSLKTQPHLRTSFADKPILSSAFILIPFCNKLIRPSAAYFLWKSFRFLVFFGCHYQMELINRARSNSCSTSLSIIEETEFTQMRAPFYAIFHC